MTEFASGGFIAVPPDGSDEVPALFTGCEYPLSLRCRNCGHSRPHWPRPTDCPECPDGRCSMIKPREP